MTSKTEFMRMYLPCFYDMPVLDAAKILKVAESTVRSHKIALGIRQWPFGSIRRNEFSMTWEDVKQMRDNALLDTSGEEHDILMAASSKGMNMREIYETAKRRPRLVDTDVKGFSSEEDEVKPQPTEALEEAYVRDTSEFAHLDDPDFFYTLKYEDDMFITPWTEDDIRILQGLPPVELPKIDQWMPDY